MGDKITWQAFDRAIINDYSDRLKKEFRVGTRNEIKSAMIQMVMDFHGLEDNQEFCRVGHYYDGMESPTAGGLYKFKNGDLLFSKFNYWTKLEFNDIIKVLDWDIRKDYRSDDKVESDKVIVKYTADKELKQALEGDVGIDLSINEPVSLRPFQTVVVKTGVKLELPIGYGAEIRPRSSLSKKGILIHHGTIDNGYRGEIMVTMTNLGDAYTEFMKTGDRVAQLVVHKIENIELEKIDENDLTETERGARGYGSTGK